MGFSTGPQKHPFTPQDFCWRPAENLKQLVNLALLFVLKKKYVQKEGQVFSYNYKAKIASDTDKQAGKLYSRLLHGGEKPEVTM